MPVRAVGSRRSRFSGGVPSSAPTLPYVTTFPLIENPISQNGLWKNGGTDGVHWSDVSSEGGSAIGHETGATTTDGTAIFTGLPFTRAHWAKGTVFVLPGVTDNFFAECELRLMTVISPGFVAGIEIGFKALSVDTTDGYRFIARWDGWNAIDGRTAFSMLIEDGGAGMSVQNGDQIAAQITDTGVITAYKNGVLVMTATDTTYTTGFPGMGFNLENGPGAGAGNNNKYGLSRWEAGNGALP